ncbi:threonine/serine exporter family protein [Nakamurella flavida]|uniref:Threonine/serine exporter family protein n=1 Tax=Nakamurella flavida TaxID=363630 RepID=A0A938YKZ5_9ACTN|nr:threonine/serine exporter family protein [Nakamurella flavida]MBM9477922.1 threonine/serine exporter family protein [Nakamurella flavida]MDP9778363.1 uncharacterized membrane protein YjjP (DUF1212 family) [Nakamurella flavida]
MAGEWVGRWRDQVAETVRALGPEDTQPLPRLSREQVPPPRELVLLLRALGVALLNSTESASTITTTLEDIAAAYDVDAQVLVLPTGILFRIGRDEVDLAAAPTTALRLDQIAGIEDLVVVLQRAGISPAQGLSQLEQILAAPPRFGVWVGVIGQTLLSLGFGLLLNPELDALPAYIALGLFVGLLRLVAARWPTLSVALPVVAALLVTVLTVLLVVPLVGDDPLRLATPALVSFLPGATLTIATIELATGQMVSGASRLVWGVSQLLLLTFGVFVGLSLVTVPAAGPIDRLGAWAPWVGVLVVGVGYLLFSSAPRGSLVFLWVALVAAYGAQALGSVLLTAQLSGFVGGLVLVPLTQALSRIPYSPPAAVMMLPAFWLLVPGALGFRGVSELANGLGAGYVVATAISVFAIALGVLVGTSLTRDVQAVRRSWRPRRAG